jgi:long-chain-acyl-CoA dehydrogenase
VFGKAGADGCLRLHRRYGLLLAYPIPRAYVDNRASWICSGSNELMKELIARTL